MREDGAPEPIRTSIDTPAGPPLIELRDDLHAPVGPGEQACCCPSVPAVRVVLPATPQRDHPVDLLLCAHHYRRSGATLAAGGAHVFDASGALMSAGDVTAVDQPPR